MKESIERRDALGLQKVLASLTAVSLFGAWPAAAYAEQACEPDSPGTPQVPASSEMQAEPYSVPAPPPDAALPTIEPVVPDEEFQQAIPRLAPADDPELSRPLESIEEFELRLAAEQAGVEPGTGQDPPPGTAARFETEAIGDAPIRDAELTKPLPPLETFVVTPVAFAEGEDDNQVVEVAYRVEVNGLTSADVASDSDLADAFENRSALRRGKGRAANLAQLNSRLGEDGELLKKLLAAEGWFDALVTTRIDRSQAENGQPLTAVFDVAPGKRFGLSDIVIAAAPTSPPWLIRSTLALKLGEPVVASRVLGGEARVALALPENGYPFAEIGQRDILLDPESGEAVYTLPVTVGPRGSYGEIVSEGKEAFDADHVRVLARFKPGQIYDSRQVDDLRQAMIATGLFRAVAVVPRRAGEMGPGGTEQVTLAVKQEAGPPRVIAASAGYSTGEGFRAEASWSHRNLFPPEGALIVSGVAGTQEQGASVTFRRSNAGRRDRTFELAVEARNSNYEAYSAYTGRLAARISYDSTPIWQKRLTYAYGVQLLGTSETVYDFAQQRRERRTYAIGGLVGQVGFDTTDSLLDPAKGFRMTALVEPEGSVRGGFSPYVRLRLDGSAYYQPSKSLILAARARVGSIQGVKLDALAP